MEASRRFPQRRRGIMLLRPAGGCRGRRVGYDIESTRAQCTRAQTCACSAWRNSTEPPDQEERNGISTYARTIVPWHRRDYIDQCAAVPLARTTNSVADVMLSSMSCRSCASPRTARIVRLGLGLNRLGAKVLVKKHRKSRASSSSNNSNTNVRSEKLLGGKEREERAVADLGQWPDPNPSNGCASGSAGPKR